jgi:hypothetical protein
VLFLDSLLRHQCKQWALCYSEAIKTRELQTHFLPLPIWQALRATMAAPTLFDPVDVAAVELTSGALASNNPVRELWLEAADAWPKNYAMDKISCMISLGTGIPPIRSFQTTASGLSKSLAALVTETEKTAESFRREHYELGADHRYHRFSVTHGLESVGLEDYSSSALVVASTRNYIAAAHVLPEIRDSGKKLANEHNCRSYMAILGRSSPFFFGEVKERILQGKWIVDI